MAVHVVVMGVAGCGKSEAGRRIANAIGLPFIEGDEFHPAANVEKMRLGLPLDDADRAGWLRQLAQELAARPKGAVLTCSALKRRYRDVLRSAQPDVRFVHLALSLEDAKARVAARGGHFYPPSLVATQFEALEDPAGENGVLILAATAPLPEVVRQAVDWLSA